jgi:hypothetical protein
MGSVNSSQVFFVILIFQSSSILMPIIGALDIIVGFVCLFIDSCPLVYCWAFVWGLSTAIMRPLAGESIFGLVERTGNFCPALALIYLYSGQHFGYYIIVCTILTGALASCGFISKLTGIFNN